MSDKTYEANRIRAAAIRGQSKEIRNLLLNKTQLKIISLIGTGEMTSRELADHLGTSVQNANMKLEKLRKKGYLSREMGFDPSGGHMGVYECLPVCLN